MSTHRKPKANTLDAELVALSLKDPEAFYYIMERYETKLLRYIQRFSNISRESAEDILQEAFIKMYRHLHNYDPTLSFSTWAYRIVHNETIDYLRKKARSNTLSLDHNESGEMDTTPLLNILKSETDIVKEVSRKEQTKKVHQILQKLPLKYREVLILHYLEDKDYQDISAILKKPIGTVGTLLRRGKEQFKHYAQTFHLF